MALSHLHFDHAGNAHRVGGVPVLVSETDAALLGSRDPHGHGVLPERLRIDPATMRAVDLSAPLQVPVPGFETGYDVYDDGSLLLLPTPGHSDGSMSLLVRRRTGAPLLLVGDLTYDPELLARGIHPDVGDRRAAHETAERIAALRAAEPELVILAAHDPQAASRLEAAG